MEIESEWLIEPGPEEVPEEEQVFFVVEEMPLYRGCEDSSGDISKQFLCTQNKMILDITSKIEYPTIAKGSGIQGIWYVSFVVNEKKEIRQVKILRSPAKGKNLSTEEEKIYKAMDEEAIRLVKSLEFATAGKQRGKPVKVQLNVPVRFRRTE